MTARRSWQPPVLLLAERYLPSGSWETALADAARVIATGDTMIQQGTRIRFLGSTLVPDDEICFSLFNADTADDVMRLMERAAIPCEHVSPALQITPRDVTRARVPR